MNGSRGIRISFLIGVGMSLVACAADGTLQGPAAERPLYPPAVFAHRVGTDPVVLYWNCTRPEPGVLRLDGVAHNPHSVQPVRFLELELVGMDGRDHSVSQIKGEAREFLLRTNQMTPFQLDLRTVGSEVRFDLFYQYRFQEGDGRQLIAGRLAGGSRLLAQTRRFMARDVCSETQHRVPKPGQ